MKTIEIKNTNGTSNLNIYINQHTKWIPHKYKNGTHSQTVRPWASRQSVSKTQKPAFPGKEVSVGIGHYPSSQANEARTLTEMAM